MARGPLLLAIFTTVALASVVSAQATTSDGPAQVTAPADRRGPPRSLLVSAGGDILAESAVRAAGERGAVGTAQRYNFSHVFEPLAAVNADVDLAICHMELPIGTPGQRAGAVGRSPFGGNLLIAPYELAAGARSGGFDRCSTASNHSYDTGFSGIVSTLDALDDSPFRVLGAAEPWDRGDIADGMLRAGVSAFGFGGNNAHLVLEEPTTAAQFVADGAGRSEGQ